MRAWCWLQELACLFKAFFSVSRAEQRSQLQAGLHESPCTVENSGLAAAVQIAWDEGTTWQRSIRVLEGL